ncbi:hypothetical protein H696_01386 [Fonticula alba]|uniref:tRNA (guanine(9)-N(1))-methyltransferase n=1 Tax=Fonticula alba TaxID=691883 RepID=A0A058ZDI6_FONAL|nr:hypothetical protein H696_01386 [Fonticula alba]KCV71978.1 hypothetical protein H696_01386 [Fonticula alba]|eukprot:XP_009493556.1 hypothetical protein H696_01386 [Fonticula alba]
MVDAHDVPPSPATDEMAPMATEAASPIEHAPLSETASPAEGGTPSASEAAPKLSKNQQRRLRRQQEWEAKSEQRREDRRQQRIDKRRARAGLLRQFLEIKEQHEREETSFDEAAVLKELNLHLRKRARKMDPMDDTLITSGVHVVLDSSFDELMSEKQINSLVRQTEHIYALNARAEYPFHLHATSFGGQYRERMDRCCSWSEWRRAGGVNFMQGSLTEELPSLVARILAGPGASSAKTAEQGAPDQDMDQSAGQTTEQAGEQAGEQIAKVSPSQTPNDTPGQITSDTPGQTPSHTPGQTPSHTSNHGLALHMDAETGRPTEEVDPAQWQSRVIYLTAESPNVVEKIAPGHIYVIGNLVDNNHHPGLCYERARQAGVRTARLPISEHIRLDTRHVLTINQVHHILLEAFRRDGDWPAVLEAVIPTRKGAIKLDQAPKQPKAKKAKLAPAEPEGEKPALAEKPAPAEEITPAEETAPAEE